MPWSLLSIFTDLLLLGCHDEFLLVKARWLKRITEPLAGVIFAIRLIQSVSISFFNEDHQVWSTSHELGMVIDAIWSIYQLVILEHNTIQETWYLARPARILPCTTSQTFGGDLSHSSLVFLRLTCLFIPLTSYFSTLLGNSSTGYFLQRQRVWMFPSLIHVEKRLSWLSLSIETVDAVGIHDTKALADDISGELIFSNFTAKLSFLWSAFINAVVITSYS